MPGTRTPRATTSRSLDLRDLLDDFAVHEMRENLPCFSGLSPSHADPDFDVPVQSMEREVRGRNEQVASID